METKIELIRNPEAEKIAGVETFNIGYQINEGYTPDECYVKVICELKFINDKKTRQHRITVSFAAIDDEDQLVGTAYENIYEKQEFFIEDVFSLEFCCPVGKEKIRKIKSYINNR